MILIPAGLPGIWICRYHFAIPSASTKCTLMYDEEPKLPSYAREATQPRRRLSRGLRVLLAVALSLTAFQYLRLHSAVLKTSQSVQVPLRAAEWLDKCQLLNAMPGPPSDFNTRLHSDRYVPGTTATLITVCGHISRFCFCRRFRLSYRLSECHDLDGQR